MFFAVHKGRQTGVFNSYSEISEHVEDYPDAHFKSFASRSDAEYFVDNGSDPPQIKIKNNKVKGTIKGLNLIRPKISIRPRKEVKKSLPCANLPKFTTMSSLKISKSVSSRPCNLGMSAEIPDNIQNKINHYHNTFPHKAGDPLYIYTDGSVTNNGKPFATGGYGIFFSDPSFKPVSRKQRGKVTNNITEINPVIEGLQILHDSGKISEYSKVLVITDSFLTYKALYCDCGCKCLDSHPSGVAMTPRCSKWEKNGWVVSYKGNKKPVANKELNQTAYRLTQQLSPEFKHVFSHTGKKDMFSCGNDIVDNLAVSCYK